MFTHQSHIPLSTYQENINADHEMVGGCQGEPGYYAQYGQPASPVCKTPTKANLNGE